MSGTHEHECDACHTVWSHSNDCKGNVAAHTCPKCGRMQWTRRLSESCLHLIQEVRNLLMTTF
jgi:predicted RNA-binding Zn-ribbon protein involved in translation (DUF1610 family)